MGVLKDKEYGKMLAELLQPGTALYTFRPDNARGLPGETLAECAADFGVRAESFGDVNEALRMASTLTFYSNRRLFLVEYNAKRMQGKGDDLVSFGKYRGHFLYEVLHVDPAYLTWIAFKFQPHIPKQERFVLIAKIYYSVHTDFQRLKLNRQSPGQFLGKEGEKVTDLTLTVTSVRVEDNPYRTQIRNGVECFFVRQLLRLKDAAGNVVNITVNAREASHASGCLPAMERAYRPGDIIQIASARVARTYVSNGVHCTRLTHVKFK